MEAVYDSRNSIDFGRSIQIGVLTQPIRNYFFDVEIYGFQKKELIKSRSFRMFDNNDSIRKIRYFNNNKIDKSAL